jgi:hypothetical protein
VTVFHHSFDPEVLGSWLGDRPMLLLAEGTLCFRPWPNIYQSRCNCVPAVK